MPTIPEALAAALEHHRAGRLAEAEQIYREILAAEPNHADAWHLLGIIAHQVGQHETAIQYMGQAIGLNGAEVAFHNDLGETYRALGNPAEAVACYRRALEIRPDHAEAHSNLGDALQGQGKLEEALGCYRRAVELRPDSAGSHRKLGRALRALGRFDEAAASYRRALDLKPEFAEAHCGLGAALAAQGKFDDAVAGLRRALELVPQHAEAHCDLGALLCYQGQPTEGGACCRRAIELKPRLALAHLNLATALLDQAKPEQAAASYRRALELRPGYAEAHSGLASALLLRGNFEDGWQEYQWRLRRGDYPPRALAKPAWRGEPLHGRTCLLHAEQGLGDTIQFVRYAPVLQQCGATVIVECPRPLLPMLSRCPGVDRLIARGDELPAFDVHAPLLSVPGILNTRAETIPSAVPYLFADAPLTEEWCGRLGGLDGFRVGINWRGRPGPGPWSRRDIPLTQFAPVAEIPGVWLVSLQRGDVTPEEQADAAGLSLWQPGPDLDRDAAFVDTAAIMKNVDLVVTSDTAVAHLAGALGVPVWVALPFAPDWRWLLDRADSPWYPTMRLFRQKSPGDWAGVFGEVAAALEERLQAGGTISSGTTRAAR